VRGRTPRRVASRQFATANFAPIPILDHQPCTRARVLTRIMVHLRLNENETNPNPHVNFITALPMSDPRDQEQARQLLRALAAQVKPIMKDHGFVVNSLEEVRGRSVRITTWL
jgi:hypothetical protein